MWGFRRVLRVWRCFAGLGFGRIRGFELLAFVWGIRETPPRISNTEHERFAKSFRNDLHNILLELSPGTLLELHAPPISNFAVRFVVLSLHMCLYGTSAGSRCKMPNASKALPTVGF